jgi:ketosteroid isomerase-like protein
MSQENIDLVRRIYDAWNEGASTKGLIAEDVEYVNPPYAVEPGVRTGRESFSRVSDVYDDVEVMPNAFLDAGDDVVVLARITGTSREAGVPIDREQAYVWTVRDGMAVRFRWFNSSAEALEAAGVSRGC